MRVSVQKLPGYRWRHLPYGECSTLHVLVVARICARTHTHVHTYTHTHKAHTLTRRKPSRATIASVSPLRVLLNLNSSPSVLFECSVRLLFYYFVMFYMHERAICKGDFVVVGVVVGETIWAVVSAGIATLLCAGTANSYTLELRSLSVPSLSVAIMTVFICTKAQISSLTRVISLLTSSLTSSSSFVGVAVVGNLAVVFRSLSMFHWCR